MAWLVNMTLSRWRHVASEGDSLLDGDICEGDHGFRETVLSGEPGGGLPQPSLKRCKGIKTDKRVRGALPFFNRENYLSC